ncbi:hypothetical protein AB833_01405 [Chromatiales bacterium (ex Bugula neritina AB1)]|nr:hypothetical protein AB833_01405 [Chromatiales bacterium (ex Bugula neritina AB1)]
MLQVVPYRAIVSPARMPIQLLPVGIAEGKQIITAGSFDLLACVQSPVQPSKLFGNSTERGLSAFGL